MIDLIEMVLDPDGYVRVAFDNEPDVEYYAADGVDDLLVSLERFHAAWDADVGSESCDMLTERMTPFVDALRVRKVR